METARPRHTPKRTRREAVDLLRGLLMILMVGDHTRIYFTNVRFTPTDLVALLAGALCDPLDHASVRSRIHITRGLWLLLLDLTLISFG